MSTIAKLLAKHPAEDPDRQWPAGTDALDWIHRAINLPMEWRADGVQIHLVDTGIISPHHPELVADPPGAIQEGKRYYSANPNPLDPANDLIDHGMAMASVIGSSRSAGLLGLAPGATVTVHQVHNWPVLLSTASRADAAKAIRAAIAAQADVISISMGFLWPGDKLRDAIADAERAGVIVVGAAGQVATQDGIGGGPPPMAPGRLDTVVCAAAINIDEEACSWSGHGDAVDLLAPGEGVWAARSFRGEDMKAPGHPGLRALRGAGTSFSTAIIASAAAHWLHQHPGIAKASRPSAFRRAIRAAGLRPVTQDSEGRSLHGSDDWGYGILDMKLLVQADPKTVTHDVQICVDGIDEIITAVEGYLTGQRRKAARAALVQTLGAADEAEANRRIESVGDALANHALDQKGWKNLGLTTKDPLPNAPQKLRQALLGARA